MAFHGFKSKIFPFQTAEVRDMSVHLVDHKVFDCSRLKILSCKQMLLKLPIALAWIKAGNTSEKLLKEVKSYVLCIEQKKLLKNCITV